MRFIKVNELTLTRVILIFSLMRVVASAVELFCMAHLANIECFLYHSTFHFKYKVLCMRKLTILS